MTTVTLEERSSAAARSSKARLPRLGFLGAGWIGKNRLEAIEKSGCAEVAAIADAAEDVVSMMVAVRRDCQGAACLEELLELDLDGVVIATPSAMHAEQAIAAAKRGVAVFCQKPLGRNAAETEAVVQAAREADVLLGVDLSYRFLDEAQHLFRAIRSREFGSVFAGDLMFHNAYGPDKQWFYDPKLSGGGCVIDLGIHLVDMGLWLLNFPKVSNVTSRLFRGGRPLPPDSREVEDYAIARLDLESGATLQLSCSWKLPAGCDAVITASFYSVGKGVALRNVNGSFYDFTAERFEGTRRETLSNSGAGWGGRAIVHWARQLAQGNQFDTEAEHLVTVAETLDRIYGR